MITKKRVLLIFIAALLLTSCGKKAEKEDFVPLDEYNRQLGSTVTTTGSEEGKSSGIELVNPTKNETEEIEVQHQDSSDGVMEEPLLDESEYYEGVELTEELEETDGTEASTAESDSADISSVTGSGTVYLDPGHGGDAAGFTEFDGAQYERAAGGAAIGLYPANSLGTTCGTSGGNWTECDAVYQIALSAKAILESAGYIVVMSRDDVHTAGQGGGTAIGNWERGRRAAGYDYWVVLHADGGGGSGMHCVAWNSDPSFRNGMCDTFIESMKAAGRPIYTASGFNTGYSGNSSGTLQAPSRFIDYGGDINKMLYIEAGFMDNNDDLQYMTSETGRAQIANAILKAVVTN